MSADAVKVTVSDPATGEVLEEKVLDNDYVLICAGRTYLDGTQASFNGTHVLTVKGCRKFLDPESGDSGERTP